MSAPASRSRLVDLPDQSGRSTATLLASLSARLAVLHGVTGAAAVGSLVSGFAALGREVARTAEGARLRAALAAGRAGSNGALLWQELLIEEWASASSPSPILDHLRNDLALLFAGDLAETLELMPIPGEPSGVPAEDARATFLDCVLGLWAYSREMTRAIEAMVGPKLGDVPVISNAAARPPPPDGSILR